jgi:hypothetical protein
MKIFKLFAIIFLFIAPSVSAGLNGELWVTGKPVDNWTWNCGFWISSEGTAQNVRVWYWIEYAGEYFYITDGGFNVSTERDIFDTIFVRAGERIDVTVFSFPWPPDSLPLYSHFWIWFEAGGSTGDTVFRQTYGETYWGALPLPTSTPTRIPTATPLNTQTATPVITPTPTPPSTTTPVRTPTPSPTATFTWTPIASMIAVPDQPR